MIDHRRTRSVAVVGAGGFIGQRLCQALRSQGDEVVAISSASAAAFDADRGLLNDRLPPERPLDGVAYLSQSPHYRDVPRHAAHLWGVNVVSAIKAAEWARRSGARRFLYASSGNVYQPAFHPYRERDALRRDDWYALSKVQAEEALRLYQPDLQVTCARLFGVYGPAQRGKLIPNLIESVRSGLPIYLAPHPDNQADKDGLKLSLSHVDDVVTTLMAFLNGDGPTVVNVAGDDVRSIREIATMIGERTNDLPRFCAETAPRPGDFVADTGILRATTPAPFRDFASGLSDLLPVR